MNKYYNVKEFLCPVCTKDFKKLRQLKQHMLDSHNQSLSSYKKVKHIENILNCATIKKEIKC